MPQILKTLWCALTLVFAVSATVATSASSAPLFHAESAPATLTGTGPGEGIENFFKFTSGAGKNLTARCVSNSFRATMSSSTETTLDVFPSYSQCKFAGLLASAAAHSCGFRLHLLWTSSPPTALADVWCGITGDTITFTQGGCIVNIGEQTGLAHVVFDNVGAGTTREIKMTVHLEGLSYEIKKGCPNTVSNLVTTDGAYAEEVIFTGEEFTGFNHVGIWVE
jgi:hypothetical protein